MMIAFAILNSCVPRACRVFQGHQNHAMMLSRFLACAWNLDCGKHPSIIPVHMNLDCSPPLVEGQHGL